MSLEVYSEVEIELWIKQNPSYTGSQITQPRFLGYGYQTDSNGEIVRWQSSAGSPQSIPSGVNRQSFWTAHHVSFNNKPKENRQWYFNCLESPPTIVEALPSLTSAITDFGSISATLIDPDVRRFFIKNFSEISTQNPVRIYRVICAERTTVWRGYIEGVGFTESRKTVISVRPVTKRFDRMADFGFNNKAQRWLDNNFKIPIVAARIIPWTVQAQGHSAIGAEPWNHVVRDSDYSSPDRDFFGWGDSSVAVTYDYGFRALGSLVSSSFTEQIRNWTAQQRSQAQSALSDERSGRRPSRSSGLINNVISFLDGSAQVLDASRSNFDKHLEFKQPEYVSFNPGELTPSVITMTNDGAMTFERGIFFRPSEEADVSGDFNPIEDNYQIAPIPQGANTIDNLNAISACHLEKFFLGVQDLTDAYTDGIVPLRGYPGGGEFNPFITKAAAQFSFARRPDGNYDRRISTGITGFDPTAVFPSLNLGDSYCNWTQVPTLVQGVSRDSNRNGYLAYPPVQEGGRFVQPIIKYMRWDSNSGSLVETSKTAHPLDSFYRWTYPQESGFSPARGSSSYLRALVVTPHATSLVYIDPLSGAEAQTTTPGTILRYVYYYMMLGSARGNTTAPERRFDGVPSLIAYPAVLPGQTFRANNYTYVQWSTFVIVNGGANAKRNHGRELTNFFDLGSIAGAPSWYLRPNHNSSAARGTYLSNGRIPVGMARTKDMYGTTSDIDKFEQIKPASTNVYLSDTQVNISHQGGSVTNLRVMPALPKTDSQGTARNHEYPTIVTEKSPEGGGAYYVAARYGLLDEVGYFDSHIDINPSAATSLPEGKYFKGYYHHDQSGTGQGVAPVTFIKAVVNNAGFEADFDHTTVGGSTPPVELTNKNPMQLISDSSQSYAALLNRLMAGLGKSIRLNHQTDKIEFVDWTTIADESRRKIVATFDEDCTFYQGSTHSASSRASSFIFENPDMTRGVNTLNEFSDKVFELSRYTGFRSTPFLQGRTITLQTGTWWENPFNGVNFYEKLTSILTSRIDIIEFSVPTQILLTFGAIGTIKVGSWVQVLNQSIPDETVQVFITETHASELSTNFRGYSFAKIIKRPDEKIKLSVSSLTQSIREGQTAMFQVSADFISDTGLNFNYRLSQVGSFLSASVSLGDRTSSIPAGQKSTTLSFATTTNEQRDSSRSATLSIRSGTGYTVGSPSSSTISILYYEEKASERIRLGSKTSTGLWRTADRWVVVSHDPTRLRFFTFAGKERTSERISLSSEEEFFTGFWRTADRWVVVDPDPGRLRFFNFAGVEQISERTNLRSGRWYGLWRTDNRWVVVNDSLNRLEFFDFDGNQQFYELLGLGSGSWTGLWRTADRWVVIDNNTARLRFFTFAGTEQTSESISLGSGLSFGLWRTADRWVVVDNNSNRLRFFGPE